MAGKNVGDGFIVGTAREEQECARLVRLKYPGARGVTYSTSGKCHADFGMDLMGSTWHRFCIFTTGNILHHCEI